MGAMESRLGFTKSLGPEFLAVNVVNPRLMAVAATLSKLSVFVTLIVCHAPTPVSDLEDRSFFFFRQTGDLILRMRKAFPRSAVLLAIDANARVGSETCDNIGGAGTEKRNRVGPALQNHAQLDFHVRCQHILGCWMDMAKHKDDDEQN